MRFPRTLRSTVTVCLLAVLAALGTGLPSHHHGEAMNAGTETRLIPADHHAHGTQLVEQDDRVPAGGVQVVVPVQQTLEPSVAAHMVVEPVPHQLPRPQDRAPPPGAPRAPPVRL